MKSYQVVITDPRLKKWGLPRYETEASAGIDLRACLETDDIVIQPGEVKLIKTGMKLWINDPNYAGLIVPRSGMGHKHGLVLGNGTGVIDSDYQGELMVSLLNRNFAKEVKIEAGERIAQLLITPIRRPILHFVSSFEEETDRGAGGFGSTGKS